MKMRWKKNLWLGCISCLAVSMNSALMALQVPDAANSKISKYSKQIKSGHKSSAKSTKSTKSLNTAASDWYIRLIAESPESGLMDRTAQLGQLGGKKPGNGFDLKTILPFSENYLYIAFVDPELHDPELYESVQYKTSFHSRNKQDRWEFSVLSGDPDAEIVLSWEGLYALDRNLDKDVHHRYRERFLPEHERLSKIILIDNVTGDEMPLLYDNEKMSYRFNMEGVQERTFSVLLSRKSIYSEPFTSQFGGAGY